MAPKPSSWKLPSVATLLLVLVGCWSYIQLEGWYKALGGVFPVLAVGVGLAQFVFGKLEAERWKKLAAGILRRTLGEPRGLSVGWALFAVVALSYSTLVVLPDAGGGKARVAVAPAGVGPGEETEIGGGDSLRRAVFFPFGRSFTVRAAGYLPTDVRVYPLLPRNVRLGADVRPLPSVLLRPPPRALVSLAQGGRFEIVRVDTGQVVAQGAGEGAHALLVGGAGSPSEAQRAGWENEIASDHRDRERILQAWSHPLHLDLAVRAGTTLEARIHDPDGTLTASQRFEVPSGFDDVPMQEVIPP